MVPLQIDINSDIGRMSAATMKVAREYGSKDIRVEETSIPSVKRIKLK